MKGFQKLALVTAIAAIPMTGFAMEPMEDEALSAVTGQDGVTISIASTTIGAIRIKDNDGFTGGGTVGAGVNAGAIFISGFSMTGATTVTLDADDDTIQIGLSLGAGTIALGNISATATGAVAGGTTLISMGSLVHTGITANVQLGGEDQGHMIVLAGTVTGGLALNGFSLADTNSGGVISMNLLVTSAGSANLALSGNINATATGLTIAGLTSMDVSMNSLVLGGGAAIGDVSILGLTVGTVTISGH